MKFIHTADIHWGMIPDSDKPWGKKREQAIRLTFQGIIEDARDSRADLLLISGDLFHRQPLARDLKEVNYLFSTIPGARVVIMHPDVPGSSCSMAVMQSMFLLTGMHWLHPRSPISPLGISTSRRFSWKTAWPTQVPRNRST